MSFQIFRIVEIHGFDKVIHLYTSLRWVRSVGAGLESESASESKQNPHMFTGLFSSVVLLVHLPDRKVTYFVCIF